MRYLPLFASLVLASCQPAAGPDPPVEAHHEAATATHRRVCLVVGPLTKSTAENAFDAYVTGLSRPDLIAGLVAYRPGWDGFSQPPPAPYLWYQCFQGSLADAAIYAAAADQLVVQLALLRRYEGLVVPDEVGDPANTLASIYAGHSLLTRGYDSALPVADIYAAMAAHVESGIISGLLFPPQTFWQ